MSTFFILISTGVVIGLLLSRRKTGSSSHETTIRFLRRDRADEDVFDRHYSDPTYSIMPGNIYNSDR